MKEALKRALEALEAGDWYIGQLEMLVYSNDDTGTHENRAKVQAAITAIKEALTQPAQEPTGMLHIDRLGQWLDASLKKRKRPWVGLTEAEAQWLYDNCRTPSNLMEMVEAKLKELNT